MRTRAGTGVLERGRETWPNRTTTRRGPFDGDTRTLTKHWLCSRGQRWVMRPVRHGLDTRRDPSIRLVNDESDAVTFVGGPLRVLLRYPETQTWNGERLRW